MTATTFVRELELPARLVHLLEANGVTSETALRDLTREAFLSWRGAGVRSWNELNAVKPQYETDGIVVLNDRPSGYRVCSAPVRLSEKAVLVGYYDWMLWLPKRSVRLVGGRVCAPITSIERAKDYVRNARIAGHSAPQMGVKTDLQ